MKSLFQPRFDATVNEKQLLKRQSEETMRLRGSNRTPDAPRDVLAQSGSRKVLISWKLPVNNQEIIGWRIYRGDETTLIDTIGDKGQRLKEVAAQAGNPSEVINYFVSAISALGLESAKVQVKGSAQDEAGAPTDAVAPAGFALESSGGLDTRGGGTGFGRTTAQ